jgi:TPR repeat protein
MTNRYNYVDKGNYIRFIGFAHSIKNHYFKLLTSPIIDIKEVNLMFFNKVNYKKIIKEYLKVIDYDFGIISYNIGVIYQLKAKNYKKMKQYYQVAIDNGIYESYSNLGKYYFKKKGKKNIKKGVAQLLKGVDYVNLSSIAEYTCYLIENNMEMDLAQKLLQQAEKIDNTDLDVLYSLLYLYLTLNDKNKTNRYDVQCFLYYRRAKQFGSIDVCVLYALNINICGLEEGKKNFKKYIKKSKMFKSTHTRNYVKLLLVITIIMSVIDVITH